LKAYYLPNIADISDDRLKAYYLPNIADISDNRWISDDRFSDDNVK
jgi:hypothetical protein